MTSLSINLPEGFVPIVKKDEKVVMGQLIASKNTTGRDHEINIANILNIPTPQVLKYLLKRPGDRVEEGTIVARKKGTMGMGGKKAVSPSSGTVSKFEEERGVLIVRSVGETQTQDLFSPVDGQVLLCDNNKITLRTEKEVILAKETLGEGNLEAVLYAVKGDEIDALDIKADAKGKIIAGKIFNREVIAKSLGLGAQGIIAGEIREEDFADLKERMVKTPIFIVEEKDLEKILKMDKKKIYIEPAKKTIIFL